MNGKMYDHAATQANLSLLRERGNEIVEPVKGELACGYVGVGKLAPVQTILDRVVVCLGGRSPHP